MSYEELMKKSDEACLKAIEFIHKKEYDLACFWKSASEGFKKRALELCDESC